MSAGDQLAAKITGAFSAAAIIKFVGGMIVVAVIAGVAILAFKRMNWVATAWILEKRGSGSLMASEDFISRKKCPDGTYEYNLLKAREPIREITLDHLYPLTKKKNATLLVKGDDGFYRPSALCLDYADENGTPQPYIKPIDVDLRDWAFQKQTQKLEKYTLKTAWDKVSPFLTIAVTGMICVIMLHLTMKNMTGA